MRPSLIIGLLLVLLVNSACPAVVTAQGLSANASYSLEDQSVTEIPYNSHLRPAAFGSTEQDNVTKEPKASPLGDPGPVGLRELASYSQYSFFVGKVYSGPIGSGAGDSSVTFTAVANNIGGMQSSDWVGFLPINMAYGFSSNHVWIQMAIVFRPGGAVDFVVEQNNYNGGSDYDYGYWYNWREWSTSFSWPQNIGVSYVVGHTYHFSIFDTDSTHVQVNISDDTSGGFWAKTIAVPSTSLLYWPDPGGFSPATTVEGLLALSVTSLSSFPYFQFDVTHNMQNVYWTMYSTKGTGAPSSPPSGVSQFLSKTYPHSWWGWAAVSFSSDIPTPAIDSVTTNPSGSVTLGQSFTIDVWARNTGTRTSSWTTIQISFPTNPSTSAISVSGSSTIGSPTIYPVGYNAPAGYGFRIGGGSASTNLQYPFVEGASAVSPGSSKLLRVTVTPPSAGTFRFYVKSVAGYGDRAVVWAPDPDTSSTRDQQSEYVVEYTKTVNSAVNAPSNLVATAVSSSRIDLSWTDNSGDESDFHIERKTGSGGSWSEIATVTAGTTSYQNTGLSASTTYYYRVRAHRHSDNAYSGYSNEAYATTSQYILRVQSSPVTGVAITWTAGTGNQTGYTNFDIGPYTAGFTVTLTAPSTHGSYGFSHWTLDGANMGSNPSLTVTANDSHRDRTAIAVYSGESETELGYDDGEPNFGWTVGYAGAAAVRFTPPTTPFVITKVKVNGWWSGSGDGTFYLEIWDKGGNVLHQGSYRYDQYFNSYTSWATNIPIPDITVSGDFYVVIAPNPASGGATLRIAEIQPSHTGNLTASSGPTLWISFDNNPPIYCRSYGANIESNTIDYLISDWNFMIRCVGKTTAEKGSARIVLDALPKPGRANQPTTISGILYGSWRCIRDGMVVDKPVEMRIAKGGILAITHPPRTDYYGRFSVQWVPSEAGMYTITSMFYEDEDLTGTSTTIQYEVISKIPTTLTVQIISIFQGYGVPPVYSVAGYLRTKEGGLPIAGKTIYVTVQTAIGETRSYECTTDTNGYYRIPDMFTDRPRSATSEFRGDSDYEPSTASTGGVAAQGASSQSLAPTATITEKGSTRIVLDASPRPGRVNQPVTIYGTLYGSWRCIRDGMVVSKPVEITTSWGFRAVLTTNDRGQFSTDTTAPATVYGSPAYYPITATFYEDQDLTGTSTTIQYEIISKIPTVITVQIISIPQGYGVPPVYSVAGYLKTKEGGLPIAGKTIYVTVRTAMGETKSYQCTTDANGYYKIPDMFTDRPKSATAEFKGDSNYEPSTANAS